MSYYTTDRLWDNERQNVHVFNWKSILEEWNESLNMHPYVQTVIENLKAVSDPDSEYTFPLEHFLKYLNWEKEAITWFIYEVVSMRYMWGETRLDFVEELIRRPEVKLDEGFPIFPGSPRSYRTVRRFLKDSLSEDELDFIDMPSPVPTPSVPSTPPRQIRQPAVAPPPAPKKKDLVYQDILIFLQRADQNGKGQPDDVIRIKRRGNLLYTILYHNATNDSIEEFTMQDYADVMYYVKNILKLNNMDKQPFEYIQFTFPGAPDILLDGDTNVAERDLVYDALERTLKNWPTLIK